MKKAKLQYVLALFLYGTTGLLLRWTILPSEVMVLCRGALGSLIIFLYVMARKQAPSREAIRKNLKWLVFGGVSLGLNWVFLFAAYRYTTVAIASLCNYLAPTFLVLLSPVLFREKLTAPKLACAICAFAGICMVSGVFSGNMGDINVVGILLGLGAAMGFVGIVVGNKRTQGVSSYDKAIIQLAVAALTVLPYVILRNWGTQIPVDGPSILWTLVLAVVHTGFAYGLYFSAMGTLPVQTAALWGYVEPIVSVLCSTLILGETLGILGIIGAVLVLGAAAVSDFIQ